MGVRAGWGMRSHWCLPCGFVLCGALYLCRQSASALYVFACARAYASLLCLLQYFLLSRQMRWSRCVSALWSDRTTCIMIAKRTPMPYTLHCLYRVCLSMHASVSLIMPLCLSSPLSGALARSLPARSLIARLALRDHRGCIVLNPCPIP